MLRQWSRRFSKIARRYPRGWGWVGVCAVVLTFAQPPHAAEPATGLAVTLAYGYDSNPLRLNDGGEDGAYAELALGGGVNLGLNPRLRWFLNGGARTRDHESALSGADATTGDVRVGFEITPNPYAYRKLLIALGGLYGVSRSTFIDRATGRVYEVESDPPTDPPTAVPIADRFDADTSGAFLDLSWSVNRRIRLGLSALLEHADYVEDYTGSTALHPLDYRAFTLEPRLFVRLHRIMGLGLSVVRTDLQYDEHPALDGNGSEVSGTTREYDYTDLRINLRLAPGKRWILEAGLRGGARVDTFAGYYDFDSQVAYLSLSHRPGERSRLQLYASNRELDYDRAAVPGSVDGDLRASDVTRVVVRFDWRLQKWLELFGEGGTQQTGNADPIYAYERDWVLTGITFRR
jgi:hypothetical protein